MTIELQMVKPDSVALAVKPQTLSSPCEACPMKPSCEPSKPACMPATGTIDFTKSNIASVIREITPRVLQFSEKIKTYKEPAANTESSSGGGPIANTSEYLRCNSCGSKYSSGTTCKHESR